MRKDYIGVLDSGIGGISVLKNLIKVLPNERFLYFGDNGNAPYGNKSLSELYTLSKYNVNYMKSYGLKLLVLGCNTLSTNLIDEIKSFSSVPTFGVFPPVEQVRDKKTLLLATTRTAEKYQRTRNLDVVGLKTLAQDIELNMFNLDKVDFNENLKNNSVGEYIDKKGYYDTVILGCTHYNFIKNEILDHFQPQNLTSGEFFTAKLVEKFMQSSKSLVNNRRFEVKFVGDFKKINKKFHVRSGQQGKFLQKKL